jgi:cytochrome d ubiquinol oxidase subunit II
MIDPVIFCALLLAFAIFMYSILDGFSLGVGILFLWAPSDHDRNVMMSSVVPFWDGNATWLIYGGAVLFAAFPIAYAFISTAFYIPITAMVISLLFRGVAFEFRMKALRSRWIWDISFWLGSTLAAFFQGAMIGAMIDGIEVQNLHFVGTSVDWYSTFSILTGLSVILAYALLGASWLVMKTSSGTYVWAASIIKPLLILVAFLIFVISLRTPILYPHIAQRWFSVPNIFYMSFIPFFIGLSLYQIFLGSKSKNHSQSFFWVITLFLFCFIGLGLSLWPYVVIPSVTIWDVAAHENSLNFMLWVSLISLPIILFYSYFVYSVFKGKATNAHY